VASGKQYHQLPTALHEIDAVTFADGFHIAGIAKRSSANANINPSPGTSIFESGKPFGIYFGLAHFDHADSCI